MKARGDIDPNSTHFQRNGYIALAALTVVNIFSYMDRSLMPALVELIKGEFALSDSQIGLLTGFSFALVYSVAGLPVARWADRGNRVNILAISVALWSLMTMATSWARSFVPLLLARMGVGIGESGCLATSYSLLSDYFPAHRRSFVLSIFLAGNTIGIIAGYTLGGWLGSTVGWRNTFLIVGAPGLLFAIVLALSVKEPPRGIFATETQTTSTSTRQALADLWANKPYLWLIIGTMGTSVINSGITLWMPAFFIRIHGLDLATVGAVFGFAYGGGFSSGLLLGGLIADRLSKRSLARPVLMSLWLAPAWLLAHVVILWAPSASVAFGAVFVASVMSGLQSPVWIAGIQNMCRARERATASAISTLLNNLFGIGLVVWFIGIASDLLAARLGNQSLRYAMTSALITIPIIAWIALCTSRSIAHKLAMAGTPFETPDGKTG